MGYYSVYHHYTVYVDVRMRWMRWMRGCMCVCVSVCVSCVGVDARCKMQDALIGVTFAGWSEGQRGV